MMTVLDLYNKGIIDYLVKSGIVSSTMLSYIEYFEQYTQHRHEGRTYRGAIGLLASEYGVSETTIKKGIRIIQAAQSNQIVTLKKLGMEEVDRVDIWG